MQYQATLRYTEPRVVQAVRCYWRRTMGPGLPVTVAIMFALLVWLLLQGNRSWLVGLVAAVVVVGLVMPVAVYLVHYKNSIGKLREMAEPIATLVADEGSFTLSSDRGTTTLKWDAVAELWRFEHFWLLLFSRAQFVTVPLEGMPQQMQSYVLDRVRSAGGKITA
jgi:hypothetical protein